MMEWRPIRTAPKDGSWILLYHRYARIGDWYWDGTEWTDDVLTWGEDEKDGLGPTHWMPLPDPPGDEL